MEIDDLIEISLRLSTFSFVPLLCSYILLALTALYFGDGICTDNNACLGHYISAGAATIILIVAQFYSNSIPCYGVTLIVTSTIAKLVVLLPIVVVMIHSLALDLSQQASLLFCIGLLIYYTTYTVWMTFKQQAISFVQREIVAYVAIEAERYLMSSDALWCLA